jgi:hypothetical protein
MRKPRLGRPFPGPKKDRLADDFAQWASSRAAEASGLSRVELTRRSGQDCRWSGYLTEIAKSNGYRFAMKRYGGRVWYFMRQQIA